MADEGKVPGGRFGPASFIRVLDMQHTFRDASLLSDEEMFQRLSESLEACLDTSTGKIGMLNPKENPEPVSRYASLWNEAVRRGFQRDDIGFGIRGHLRRSAKLSSFTSSEPPWQEFEKLTARIHVAFCRDSEVKWSEKLIDGSGGERQIDVTIRSKLGPHPVLGIVSCKCEKRPVAIAEVESFVTVKNDLKAGIAIMVSNSGYQKGALAKAKAHGVRLWTLQQAEKAAWRDEIRTFELVYPMCSQLKFCPALPANALPQETRIDLTTVVFLTPDHKRRTLREAIAIAIDQASQQCVPIPRWVSLTFPDGSTINFFGMSFPIEQIDLHLTTKVGLRQRKKMKIPTGTMYDFNEAPDGASYTIAERDLPPLKH